MHVPTSFANRHSLRVSFALGETHHLALSLRITLACRCDLLALFPLLKASKLHLHLCRSAVHDQIAGILAAQTVCHALSSVKRQCSKSSPTMEWQLWRGWPKHMLCNADPLIQSRSTAAVLRILELISHYLPDKTGHAFTMLCFRNILSASLFLIALTSCAWGQQQEPEGDLETFQKLLEQVDPPSLHEALHSVSGKKYKHGAFPEDRTAVEVIHKEEPSVATRIVKLARRQDNEVIDLGKRQGPDISNGTTPTNTPPGPNPETSTRVTPVPQTPQSSTPAPGQTTEASTSPASVDTPTTTPSAPTSSNNAPVSSPAVSTTSAGPATRSSNPSTTARSVSLTAGQVITTTNGVGLTIISTVGGGASTISPSAKGVTSTNTHRAEAQTSVVVQTSTLPDGSQSVVTAVTVVGAGASGAGETPSGTAGVGATTTSSSPGLQTGEAVMSRGWGKEMVLIVGGAVAFAGLM